MSGGGDDPLSARRRTLGGVPLFARLSPETLARLAEIATEVECPEGWVLIEAGTAGPGIFVIEEGTATVHARERDREVGPGELIGERGLSSPEERTARVQAKTALRCLAVEREAFRALLADEPELAADLLEAIGERE